MERTFYVHIRASRRNGTLYLGVTGDLPRRAYEPRAARSPRGRVTRRALWV